MLLYTSLENKNQIKSSHLGEDICNLLDRTFNIYNDFQFNIFEVTKEYIARPDLISYDAYGDAMYADVLCKLNGISNPFELNIGDKLIIPSPDSIMDFVSKVSQSSTNNEDVYSTNKDFGPVLKSKSEKRKANEAITGDTRFKVDAASGIIIY